jgi:hypothetical protein
MCNVREQVSRGFLRQEVPFGLPVQETHAGAGTGMDDSSELWDRLRVLRDFYSKADTEGDYLPCQQGYDLLFLKGRCQRVSERCPHCI